MRQTITSQILIGKGTFMNMTARIFQLLVEVLRANPESPRVDTLCHELHRKLVSAPNQQVLVAFIYRGNLDTYRWFDGTVEFLHLNGIALSKRPHLRHEGWFIFAELYDSQITQPQIFDLPILERAA
jgi:hypothetical protein